MSKEWAKRRAERWNHNLHYHSVILNAVPDGSTRALDVGCGAGILARDLRRLVPQVTGIDLDQTSIDLARHYDRDADIEYVLGDFLTHPFEPASFDVIASVAALHHMDATAALGRMRDLLRVGGTLAIVGLARSEFPADLPFDLAGIVARILPGAHYRRHLLWRYSLTWTKPRLLSPSST